MLRLSFLGAFQATLRDQPAPEFQTNKVRALLAYLAVEAEQGHQRATLAGLLWPEMPDEKARNNLSKALSLLRSALHDRARPAPHVLAGRQTVRFNPGSDYWLDVAEFQRDTGPRASVPQLERVVDLYQGEFLTGFSLPDAAAFEEWLLLWRERLHQQMLATLERLASHYLTADAEKAQHYARRQLELDAWRESAHVQLMQALALSGDRSGALAQYEACRRLLADELGVEPAAATVAMVEAIKAGEVRPRIEAPSPAVARNLPVPQTAFIGRKAELAALDESVRGGRSRLVTIVGPGGVGKTRLALAYAGRYLGAAADSPFPGGVYFVSLADLSAPANATLADPFILALIAALQLPRETARSPRQQLLDYLQPKRLLLLLDNFDTVLAADGGATALLAVLLRDAPGVHFLVTSREPLRLYGEQVYTVPGLAVPAPAAAAEAIGAAEAVQLFIRAACRIRHDFTPGTADWVPLARLCRFLGGMPLAIELAASWVDTLPVADILSEVQQDLDFLSTQLSDVAQRHRSMRRVLGYTWQHLPPDERRVLAALSVFRGGFTRRAAQAVATPDGEGRVPLPLFQNLVQKSLLAYNRARDHYELHELLRHFARTKLAAGAGEETAVRERHSAYICARVQARVAALQGPRQQEALDELAADVENVRAAWQWAVAQGNIARVAATLDGLFHFYDMRSWFQEGEEVLREAARRLAEVPAGSAPAEIRERVVTAARLQARAAWFAFHLGRQEESVRQLQTSLARLQEHEAEQETIFNYNYLGAMWRHLGEYERANDFLATGLRLARRHADPYQASISRNILGQTASLQGDYALARRHLREALRLKRELGDRWGMTYSLTYLGRVAQALDESEEARRLFAESKGISEQLGDRRGVAFAVQNLGDVARDDGRLEEAETLLGEGLAIFRDIGNRLGASLCLVRLGEVATRRGDLDRARRNLGEGLQLALAIGARPALLAGLLALARFSLRAGRLEDAQACLAFLKAYPESGPALQAAARELAQEAALPGGVLAMNGTVESFVEEWLLTLAHA